MGSLAAERHDSLVIETDVLICGTGPAGASLACFLASYGRLFRTGLVGEFWTAVDGQEWCNFRCLTGDSLNTWPWAEGEWTYDMMSRYDHIGRQEGG